MINCVLLLTTSNPIDVLVMIYKRKKIHNSKENMREKDSDKFSEEDNWIWICVVQNEGSRSRGADRGLVGLRFSKIPGSSKQGDSRYEKQEERYSGNKPDRMLFIPFSSYPWFWAAIRVQKRESV